MITNIQQYSTSSQFRLEIISKYVVNKQVCIVEYPSSFTYKLKESVTVYSLQVLFR